MAFTPFEDPTVTFCFCADVDCKKPHLSPGSVTELQRAAVALAVVGQAIDAEDPSLGFCSLHMLVRAARTFKSELEALGFAKWMK